MVKTSKFILALIALTALAACAAFSDGQETPKDFSTDGLKSATFAGGCFWCVDKHFEKVDGVVEAVTGYMGGEGTHQKHEQWKQAGYREVVQVWYNPKMVTYKDLADYHLRHIDPLNAEGQFCDKGNSYYGTLYYANEQEQNDAINAVNAASEILGQPVVTLIEPQLTFYPAAKHHQDYYKKYSLKYDFTTSRCGRYKRIKEVWGERN